MTEPLIVDTDRLDAASAALKAAAERIPTRLPQFSVTGSDPLSMAIDQGAMQVEEPMAALPALQAEAITVAHPDDIFGVGRPASLSRIGAPVILVIGAGALGLAGIVTGIVGLLRK